MKCRVSLPELGMTINQAVGQKKAQGRGERDPASWRHADTRNAILGVAREMIGRDGLEKVSLMRVAEEAGFAPHTVYAYFVRKADLIAAIVADDLAAFAKTIADGFPFSKNATLETCEADIADEEPAATDACDTVQTSAEAIEPAESAAETTFAETVDPKAEDQNDGQQADADDDVETVPPACCDDIVTDAVETDRREPPASVESGDATPLGAFEARLAQLEARRVDPWLERRLREFERMLAALEERTTAAERSNTAASAPIEIRLDELSAGLAALEKKQSDDADEAFNSIKQKLEASELTHRQTWTELRTLMLDISGRTEVLERDRELRALAAEMPALELSPAHHEDETYAVDASHTEEPTEIANVDESYLAAARRAALAAQSLAQSDNGRQLEIPRSWFAKGTARTRLLLVLCAGLGLILMGTGLVLKEHMSSPDRAATEHGPAVRIPVLPPVVAASSRVSPAGGLSAVFTAALAGNSHAQLEAGLACLNGDGVPQNDTQAGRWLRAAALAGEPVAQYWLGTLYEHGKGEPVDTTEAIRWYEAAALQGNMKAMYKLAVSYAEGWGTPKNYSEAARWFSRAAELGFINAQYNLGVLYERGLGVPQSLLDAYKWYALAAAQGDKDSALRVQALSSQLSAEDLATAREAVAAFKPQMRNLRANATPALAAPKTELPQTHPLNG